jgi:hypothetical protein
MVMIDTRVTMVISLNRPISVFSVGSHYCCTNKHDLTLSVTHHVTIIWTNYHINNIGHCIWGIWVSKRSKSYRARVIEQFKLFVEDKFYSLFFQNRHIVRTYIIRIITSLTSTTLTTLKQTFCNRVMTTRHYRNRRLCRVQYALPRAFCRALGKEGFAECRTR